MTGCFGLKNCMPSRIATNTTVNTSREFVSCFPPCWLGFLYSAKRLPVAFNFRTAFQRKRFHYQARPAVDAGFSAVSIVPRRFWGSTCRDGSRRCGYTYPTRFYLPLAGCKGGSRHAPQPSQRASTKISAHEVLTVPDRTRHAAPCGSMDDNARFAASPSRNRAANHGAPPRSRHTPNR